MSRYDLAPLHEALNLRVGESIMKPYSAAEMRTAIYHAAQASPWIRRSFMLTDTQGFSGEDRYVHLAFHMLLEAERQQCRDIDEAMLKP
jgi:hypothetical protein